MKTWQKYTVLTFLLLIAILIVPYGALFDTVSTTVPQSHTPTITCYVIKADGSVVRCNSSAPIDIKKQEDTKKQKDIKKQKETPIPTLPTPTPPTPEPAFKFVAWGDTKSGVNILEAESKSIAIKNPDFTLYTGDVCDKGPDQACFIVHKNAINGDLTGTTSNGLFSKTFAVRGNHDSDGGFWSSVFNFSDVAVRIGATNYNELTNDMTYSFDYGNSHFVGIDIPGDVDIMTPTQINWLDQDLRAAENRGLKHAFLFWHGPIYSVDGHPATPPSYLITVLNKHPIVSAAFFGHEHVVEYTHLDSNIVPSLSCSFEQVITGGGGAPLYSLSSGKVVDYYLDQSQGRITYGYTMIGVSGNDFSISFYKTDGTLMKTLSFTETNVC